jgi:hypothetical protein
MVGKHKKGNYQNILKISEERAKVSELLTNNGNSRGGWGSD